MSFKGKVVLITGASSGIGAVTALLFAKEGASVALVGRREDKLQDVTAKCMAYENGALTIVADVCKEEEASTIVKRTVEKFGKLDVLLNNAATIAKGGLLSGNLFDSYDKIMNTNLRAVILITSLAVPHLVESKGNIINVSSTLGAAVSPYWLAYSISKAGLDHFSKGAALELAPTGVRVNVVGPGPVSTNLLQNCGLSENIEELGKMTPLGKSKLKK